MAILAKDEIIKRIDAGEIIIEPLDRTRIGPASIDLTLDDSFRIFKNIHSLVHLTENPDIDAVSEIIKVTDFLTLMPNQTAHGVTKEKITFPPNVCGWIQGRSRFARFGLMVHVTASFIQPGTSNHQVLEMNNAGPMPIAIHPGISVCQIIFEETIGSGNYNGKYTDQKTP
jgi:dCTP deaminase